MISMFLSLSFTLSLQILILNSANALLFCNETESDLRLEFDRELLKYRGRNNLDVFILNSKAVWGSGSVFNVTCASKRAVNWRFHGLTANSLITTDRYRNHDATCHLMSLNFTAIDEQITGTYSCYEITRTWRSVNFTLFAGHVDDGNFLRLRGKTLDIQPQFEDSSVVFPCGVNDPKANVTLYSLEPEKNELEIIANSTSLEFDPVQGFTINVTQLGRNNKYKCQVLGGGSDTVEEMQMPNVSDSLSLNYNPDKGILKNLNFKFNQCQLFQPAQTVSHLNFSMANDSVAGPIFLPDSDRIILPRNATTYQIQCIAPYPIYITTDGPLTFHISNDTSIHPGIMSVFATFKPDTSSSSAIILHSSTNVSCLMQENDTMIKNWNVQRSEMEFKPGLYFDQTSATATCFSSTPNDMDIFHVFCETDTECEFQKKCLTEREVNSKPKRTLCQFLCDWKCPVSPDNNNIRTPNIISRNETSVTVDLMARSGMLSCISTDLTALISFYVRADGEIALDSYLDNSFMVEILGNRTVSTDGTVTAQCTASRRLVYSKVNLELWNGGKLMAYVQQDLILQDELVEIPGLFIRKVTFRVPPGEFDEVICFVETYSPKTGYTKGTPLTVYQNIAPPVISGPKFIAVNLMEDDFRSNNNLTCEVENWSNISWEIPPTLKFTDLIVGEVTNLTMTRSVSQIFIPELNPKYAGVYLCVVSNHFGLAQKEFTVHVIENKLPWPTIAIVTGIIVAFGMLVYIWWMVRKAIAMQQTQQQQPHRINSYPLELTSSKDKEAEEALENILRQFREGIWPLTSAEKDAFELHYELDGATQTKSGNYVAMITPYDFTQYEIPAENIEIDVSRVLGSGEFGIVHGGKLRLHGNNGGQSSEPVQVAIKRLQSDANSDYVASFLKELQIMIYVGKHSNIVELLGACTKSNSIDNIFVVLKLCLNGSLEKYLRTRRKVFVNQIGEDGRIISHGTSISKSNQNYMYVHQSVNTQDLLRWTIQISSGMEFLAEKKVIHGDLACRNVLLDEQLNVKISDFGLARRLYEYTKYIKKEQGLLPWRWMAIESLQDLHFSPASDVWAFGITAWEIFTLSEIPYPGIVWSLQFVEQLLAGHRNVKPKYATEEIFSILKTCWLQDAADRPTMSQLKERLSSIFANYFISYSTDYINI